MSDVRLRASVSTGARWWGPGEIGQVCPRQTTRGLVTLDRVNPPGHADGFGEECSEKSNTV